MAEVEFEIVQRKNQANGYLGLGPDGQADPALLPAHGILSSEHSDVDAAVSPLDNWALTFNAVTGKWEPGGVGKMLGYVFARDYGVSYSVATTTGSITAATNALAVASAAASFKIGHGIRIAGAGAGGGALRTRVTGVSANTLTLRDAAAFTVSGARVDHDDTEAIDDALAACKARAFSSRLLGTVNGQEVRAYHGVPPLVFHPGRLINYAAHPLRYLSGFRVISAGKKITTIEHRAGTPLWIVNRSMDVEFTPATWEVRDPTVPDPPRIDASTTVELATTGGTTTTIIVASSAQLYVGLRVTFTSGATTETKVINTIPNATSFTLHSAVANSYPVGSTVTATYVSDAGAFTDEATGTKRYRPDPPAGTSYVKGLIEGSIGCLITQRKEDNLDGTLAAPNVAGTAISAGSTLRIQFTDVELLQFHRAYEVSGNVQCDDFKWTMPRLNDCYEGWFFGNGQAVGQRVYDGDVIWGGNFAFPIFGSDAHYTNRLSAWSAPTEFADGRSFRILAGGQILVNGTEFEGGGTHVLQQELSAANADPANAAYVGTNAAQLPIIFVGARFEMRRHDSVGISAPAPGGGTYKIQRHTMFRPDLMNAVAPYRSQIDVICLGCRWNINPQLAFPSGAVMNLWHLRNALNFRLYGCGIENPGQARLLSVINNDTPNAAGSYHSQDTNKIGYLNQPTDSFTGTGNHRVAHRVTMERPSRAASLSTTDPQDNGDFIIPFNGEGAERRTYKANDPLTSKLPGSAGAQTTFIFNLAPNQNIWEWGVATAANPTGASIDMTFQLRTSSGAVITSLAYNSTTNPNPSAFPKNFTGADGVLQVHCSVTTTSEIRGLVYVVVG